MGTTTKVNSATGVASDRFQSWFTDNPKESDSLEDLNKSPSPNQPVTSGQTLTFENVRIDFPLRPCMFSWETLPVIYSKYFFLL